MGNNFSKSSFDKNQDSFDENERKFRKASRNRGLKCIENRSLLLQHAQPTDAK